MASFLDKPIDIKEAQTELEKWNKTLQDKCKDLSLRIDYYKDMEDRL